MKTLIYFYSHHNQTVECSSEDLRTRDVEDEGIAIGEPNATLNTSDASKFRHLRDKLQQWSSDLKKRRNSQVILTTSFYGEFYFEKKIVKYFFNLYWSQHLMLLAAGIVRVALQVTFLYLSHLNWLTTTIAYSCHSFRMDKAPFM